MSKEGLAMGLCHSRKSFAVAMILAGGWGQLPLSGQDRFIVQPSRRPVTAATTTVAPTAAADAIAPKTSAPTLPAVELATAPPVSPATPVAVVTAAPPLNELLESPVPQVAARADATPVGPTGTGDTQGESPLRWIARSELAAAAQTHKTTAPALPKTTDTSIVIDMPSAGTQGPAATTKPQASLVSSQIIRQRPAENDASGRAVAAIDAPPGWQAIGTELSQRINNCETLLNRKAYYSAREEADAAMLYLVRVLDLMSNRYTSEPAWYAARKAMHEAEDFSTAQRLTSDSDFLRRIIMSHETPVLKDVDASELAPLAAAQHYRQYAELKLVEAAEGHPWAAEIAYALGRTYQAQADVAEDGSEQMLRWRAVTLYRAARVIAPGNALAANQLGFVLLQMDRPLDARSVLIDSLNANPSAAAYQNLVEASRRLGDTATGNWALQQAVALGGSQPAQPSAPEVVEVDPRTFAALSPYTAGPTAPANQAPPQVQRTATLPTSANRY